MFKTRAELLNYIAHGAHHALTHGYANAMAIAFANAVLAVT